uniref:probable serine/threonine-protein kinase samkC isoform X2 n=1 Tax=Oncorhynchus gorbuscha TaxID=8017 RepID=UPI001EAEE228|nr:probable serine/threonine-protein kinase samkC isoform X2 [Oncorhynchus gorbuscha]
MESSPLVPHPMKSFLGNPEESDPLMRWRIGSPSVSQIHLTQGLVKAGPPSVDREESSSATQEMCSPPPLVSHPRNICMGKPEESDPQRRWSYGPSPPDPSVPGLGEGRPPPPVPHPRKINMSKPEESKPQRRWSYGQYSKSVFNV